MEQKVLIPSDISQPGKDYLRERGYVIKMGRGIDEQTIMEDAADCDALLARNEHITRGIMEAAPHLKVISKHGVGLDKIDLDAARDLNIWVTNGPLSNTVAVAEHTMMLILACAKKLVLFDKAIRNGDYEIRNRVKGLDLEGKTLAMIFAKNSTRTRNSFEVGVYQLGGLGHYMNAATELQQSGRGEPLKDTARVLGRYYDCVVWRTYRQCDLEEFAELAGVPVINGLRSEERPVGNRGKSRWSPSH